MLSKARPSLPQWKELNLNHRHNDTLLTCMDVVIYWRLHQDVYYHEEIVYKTIMTKILPKCFTCYYLLTPSSSIVMFLLLLLPDPTTSCRILVYLASYVFHAQPYFRDLGISIIPNLGNALAQYLRGQRNWWKIIRGNGDWYERHQYLSEAKSVEYYIITHHSTRSEVRETPCYNWKLI